MATPRGPSRSRRSTRVDAQGAVRVHAAREVDDETTALLIERCVPGEPLAGRPESEQDGVIAGLLPRLWREPGRDKNFRPLQQMCDAWADSAERKLASRPTSIDAGLAREGIALFRLLPRTAERHVLVCTDLHAGNVLAAEREPWLVIDPKPYVGDPTYDPVQHLLNCEERLRHDPVGLARRLADLCGVDSERLVLWLFARCVQESPTGRTSQRSPAASRPHSPQPALTAEVPWSSRIIPRSRDVGRFRLERRKAAAAELSASSEQVDVHTRELGMVDLDEAVVEVELDLGLCKTLVCVDPVEDDPQPAASALDARERRRLVVACLGILDRLLGGLLPGLLREHSDGAPSAGVEALHVVAEERGAGR